MNIYEEYLIKVRENNLDEYQEIGDIISRYKTLKNSNNKLTKNLESLESKLEELKNDVTQYDKKTKTDIMSLNNDITNLKQRYEKVED